MPKVANLVVTSVYCDVTVYNDIERGEIAREEVEA
jgi:hypothetical protein